MPTYICVFDTFAHKQMALYYIVRRVFHYLVYSRVVNDPYRCYPLCRRIILPRHYGTVRTENAYVFLIFLDCDHKKTR